MEAQRLQCWERPVLIVTASEMTVSDLKSSSCRFWSLRIGVDGRRSKGASTRMTRLRHKNEASAKTKSLQVHFIFPFPFTDSVEVLPRGQYRTCRQVIDTSVSNSSCHDSICIVGHGFRSLLSFLPGYFAKPFPSAPSLASIPVQKAAASHRVKIAVASSQAYFSSANCSSLLTPHQPSQTMPMPSTY